MARLTFDQRIHAVLTHGDRQMPVKLRLVRTADPMFARPPGRKPSGKPTSWMVIPKLACDRGEVFLRAMQEVVQPVFPGSKLRCFEKPRVRASITPELHDNGYLVWLLECALEAHRNAGSNGIGWNGASLATMDVYPAWIIADFLDRLTAAGFSRFTTHDGKPIPYQRYMLVPSVSKQRQGSLFESDS